MFEWIKQLFCNHYYPGSPTRILQSPGGLGITMIPMFDIYVINCVKCNKIDKQFIPLTFNDHLLLYSYLYKPQGTDKIPLVKGKKAKTKKGFLENIKREIGAGKPQKQAVAIAYSESRGKKKKK